MSKLNHAQKDALIAELQSQLAGAKQESEKFYGRLVTAKNTSGNRPEMFGEIEIEGKTYQLGAWTKTSQQGNKYLSLRAEERV